MTPDLEALRPIADELAPVVDAFVSGGFELFVVGGLVRDLAGNRSVDLVDIDLATDAEPDQVRSLLRGRVGSLWRQGERFGTIGVAVGTRKVEITTYRAEVYHPDSRKPAVRFANDLGTDLSRRDFTINAMAATLPDLKLVDPFDGMGDLRAGVLRTPLDPAISFDDDPLRMLRGARFVATLNLAPVEGLVGAMTQRSDRLGIVSAERIGDEMMKLLGAPTPGRGLALLDRAGLLEAVVPEYAGIAERHRAVDTVMVDAVRPDDPLWRLAAIYAFLDPGAVGRAGDRLRLPRTDRRRLRAITAGHRHRRRPGCGRSAHVPASGRVARRRARPPGRRDAGACGRDRTARDRRRVGPTPSRRGGGRCRLDRARRRGSLRSGTGVVR